MSSSSSRSSGSWIGGPDVRAVNVLTSQHTDLIAPLLRLWGIGVDHDLQAMRRGQSLNGLMSRIQSRMDRVLEAETPDIVLVQGDTTSALAATLAAWHRRIPVGHIEAGLRSGIRETPFPEETNRRLVTALATLHFAPTSRNADALRAEGVPEERSSWSGNPIVDAVEADPGDAGALAPDHGADRGARRPAGDRHDHPPARELRQRHAGPDASPAPLRRGAPGRQPGVSRPRQPGRHGSGRGGVPGRAPRAPDRAAGLSRLPLLPVESLADRLGLGGVQEEAPTSASRS